MLDLVIKNAHIVSGEQIIHGYIGVEAGKIALLSTETNTPEAVVCIDAAGDYIIPGGVDPHVHIRYPGGTLRETFYTGTQAAAAGGTTTIIEHPISTPPQYSKSTLELRVAAAEKEAIVDIAFYGAAGGEHINEIIPLSKEGIVGFKTFLHGAPEGRDKEFVGLTSKDNFQLMQVVNEVAKTGLLLAAHGEDNDMVVGGIAALRKDGKTHNKAHCLSRPAIVEMLAVERLITLAKQSNTRLYLVHLSCPESVEMAAKARESGLEVYIETCPHYLYLTEDDVERYGSFAKCNPPLRDAERVAKLWAYVMDGTVDAIGSDHAPYNMDEKLKCPEDIFVAPSGFPGIETRLGFILRGVNEGKISLIRAVKILSENPAEIFGLANKGKISLGYDADLVLLNPYEAYQLQSKNLFTMAKDICAFLDGQTLYGKVKKTWVRGQLVFDDGKFTVEQGFGKFIKPSTKRCSHD